MRLILGPPDYTKPQRQELDPKDLDAYAEIYIEQMEECWMQGRPYRSSVVVAKHIMNENNCQVSSAVDVKNRMIQNHISRLKTMMYNVQGNSFSLTQEQVDQIRRDAGVAAGRV